MEEQGASPLPSLARCLDDVASAQIYVGIIGWRVGSRPPDRPDTTYTEAEFELATKLKLPRLTEYPRFLMPANTEGPRR